MQRATGLLRFRREVWPDGPPLLLRVIAAALGTGVLDLGAEFARTAGRGCGEQRIAEGPSVENSNRALGLVDHRITRDRHEQECVSKGARETEGDQELLTLA